MDPFVIVVDGRPPDPAATPDPADLPRASQWRCRAVLVEQAVVTAVVGGLRLRTS